jgi:hypothetical protein
MKTLGNLIVAANDVISLVAEYSERPELGPAIRMNEEQEAQTTLPVDLDPILGYVSFFDGLASNGSGAASGEIIAEVRQIQGDLGFRMAVRCRLTDRAQVVTHSGNQVPKFLDNSRLRESLAVEKVKDFPRRLFLDILQFKFESLGVAEQSLMRVVDEFATALGHLPGKEAVQRKASAAGPVVGVIEVCPDPVPVEIVSAGQTRQTGPHDRNSHGRTRHRVWQAEAKGRRAPTDRAGHGQLARVCKELTPAGAPRICVGLYVSGSLQALTRRDVVLFAIVGDPDCAREASKR